MKKRYVLKNKPRFFVFLSFVLTIILVGVFATSAYGYKEPEYNKVVVKHGDTLWGIAEQYRTDRDIREFIHDIKKLNKLADSRVYAGAELIVPLK